MKTFEEFMKDLKSNAELIAKLEAALAGVETAETKTAAIVKLAQENGYDVSVEDFSSHQASEHKLSEDELKLYSGGIIKGNDGKIYYSCEWDYACGGVWNACMVNNECFLQSTNCQSAILNADQVNHDVY